MTNSTQNFYSCISPKMQERIDAYYRKEGKENNVNLAGPVGNPPSLLATGGSYITSQSSESPRQVWDVSNPLNPNLVFCSISKKTEESRWPWSRNPRNEEAKFCYDQMHLADTFFREKFSRNPVLVNGTLMKANINHPDKDYKNNAAWHREDHCIYFGTVDPNVYNPFVSNRDIIFHELGHPLVQYSAGLEYYGQSGALNESIADITAVTSKQFYSNTSADDPNANWYIADGIIVREDKENGTALRSMSDGTGFKNHPILIDDDQVKHMRDYQWYGDVHTNSGIPNLAFKKAANGIGGGSWDKPAKIWFNALCNALPNDDFARFAGRTVQAAGYMYNERIQNIVGQAWYDVGVFERKATHVSNHLQVINNPQPVESSLPKKILVGVATGVVVTAIVIGSIIFGRRSSDRNNNNR